MTALDAKPPILVIGGYGVFGGRLSRRLSAHDDLEVIVAGRRLSAAQAHCREYGGTPAQIDTNGDIDAAIRKLQPTIVVDAAGPFQSYSGDPYRIVRAAMRNGAHYLDLADDGDFVAGISSINDEAVTAECVALSGCSSVPAISSAAVASLSHGLASIDQIESIILPGNRAPRGRSVIEAILAQVGKPIKAWRAGEWSTMRGWCDVTRASPKVANRKPLGRRYASPIGAPDLQLFPSHYAARTVRFKAGLELSIMHLGLAALAWLVRLGLMRSATPLSGWLLWVAEWLKPFGSDRGAMTVDVVGRTHDGVGERRTYTIIAEAGDGPEIPSTPAYVLARRLCREPERIPFGARPCLDEMTIEDVEQGLKPFAINSGRTTEEISTVFERALSDGYAKLPAPIRDLHNVLDERAFVGLARVQRGNGVLSRTIGWCMGFPPAADDIEVRVDMKRTVSGETWRRRFGNAVFCSHLSRRSGAPTGQIWERFGPLSFRINLHWDGDALHYPVDAVRLLGFIALPSFLVPSSQTREYADDSGAPCFDVRIDHPLAGFIVRYEGRLQPIEALASGEAV